MLDAEYSCGFIMLFGDGEGHQWRVTIWRTPNKGLEGHGIARLDLPQDVITQIMETDLTPTDDGVEVELKYAERLVERMFIPDYDFRPTVNPKPPY